MVYQIYDLIIQALGDGAFSYYFFVEIFSVVLSMCVIVLPLIFVFAVLWRLLK